MEKTRQYSALGLLGWLGIVTYAACLLSAAGMLISLPLGMAERSVTVLGPAFLVAAIARATLAIVNAMHSGTARWSRKAAFSRDDRPYLFLSIIVANVLVAAGFAFALLVITGVLQ